MFLCPSDPEPAVHTITSEANTYTWAGSNYAINGSSGVGSSQNCDPFANETDGLCYKDSNLRLAQITDGLSNTVAFAESLRGPCDEVDAGVTPDVQLYVAWLGLAVDSLIPTADVAEADGPQAAISMAACWNSQRLANWFKMDMIPGTIMVGRFPPNSPIPDLGARRIRISGPRNRHPGGVNVAMADGSVRYLTDGVGVLSWRALWTRAGGGIVTTNL